MEIQIILHIDGMAVGELRSASDGMISATFFADMGERPSGLSIERINNDGNYDPDNCKWATKKEQSKNMGYSGPILDKSDRGRFFLALNLNSGDWGISNNYREFAEQKKLNPVTVVECLYSSRTDTGKVYKGWEFNFMD